MGSASSNSSSNEIDEDDSMEEDEQSMSVFESDETDEHFSDPENTIMLNNHDSVEYSRESIIIPTSVVDLKEMASLNVAIALWNHSNIPRFISETNSSNSWIFSSLERALFERVFESRMKLPVPLSVSEHIGEYVTKMRKEIHNWIEYHYRHVFFNHISDKSVFYYIYYIVWYCNGTINYKESARSLLNCPRLSEIEKYHLLCTYCLKDDIERMPSLPLLHSNNVAEQVNFTSHPLIFYWNCYFRKEIEKITMISGSPVDLDCYMIKRRYVDNWPAKEYFFDRLTSDEQVQMAIWLIDNHGIKYLKLIIMKLTESQRLRVYMDRSVQIMMIYANTGANQEDILATWSEIRNLIVANQFMMIFKKMLTSSNGIVLNDMWTSASDEFKRYLMNSSQQSEIMEFVLRLWVNDKKIDVFFSMMHEANASSKQSLCQTQYFLDICDKFISEGELKLLDRLLNSCFSDAQELAMFKRHLTNEDNFVHRSIRMIVNNEVSVLDQLLGHFLPDPESTLFKRNLSKKEYFSVRCRTSIIDNDFPALVRLLNECFPSIEESTKFKQDLTKEESFTEHCKSLIVTNMCPVLEQLLHVFFPQTEDLSRFKLKLTTAKFFFQHCEYLIQNDNFQMLDDLLNWFLLDAEEVLKFKRDLILNSKPVKSWCLDYFSNGNFKMIDALLTRFLSSYPELIPEYKKNLILSPEALSNSIDIFATRPDVLNTITIEGFIPDDLAIELRRKVIFSYSVAPTIQTWIRDGRINLLKERTDQFLITEVDKRAFKMQVFGNPMEFVRNYFFRNDEKTWQSLMLWRFEDLPKMQEYKGTMPVDEIFDDILKKCVFETFDPANLRFCKFRSQNNFELKPLDRFLIWYFETPRHVKEYKLRRIDSYMYIETIRMLLKKSKPMHLNEVMAWIFEKDDVEITKFKMKNKGRKILKYIDILT